MQFTLKASRMIAEARAENRLSFGKYPALDLLVQMLIFVAIFLIIAILEGSLASIFVLPLLFFDPQLADILNNAVDGQALDPNNIIALSNSVMQSSGFTILMLFATIVSIGSVLIYCRFIEKRRLPSMGLRRGRIVREYLLGWVVGVAMFCAVVAIAWLSGSLSYIGLGKASVLILLLLLLGFMVQSMSEELLCRGYLLATLAKRQNLAVAVFVSSCLFGLMHLANSGVTALAIINIILFGTFAGVYMLKRGDIWGVAAIHGAWNFTQGSIFGASVSGLTPMPSVFSFEATADMEWLSGGAFGLEGGLAASLVLVVALIFALLMKTKDPSLASL